jgi:hypothetical protein
LVCWLHYIQLRLISTGLGHAIDFYAQKQILETYLRSEIMLCIKKKALISVSHKQVTWYHRRFKYCILTNSGAMHIPEITHLPIFVIPLKRVNLKADNDASGGEGACEFVWGRENPKHPEAKKKEVCTPIHLEIQQMTMTLPRHSQHQYSPPSTMPLLSHRVDGSYHPLKGSVGER